MAIGPQQTPPRLELPPRRVTRMMEPLQRFLHIEAMSGVVLLAAAAAALVIANSPWSDGFLAFWETKINVGIGGHQAAYSLRHIINDGLMTLFFFVVGLEIKREMVHGELRDPRAAALPLAAALGGMVVPALLYLALQFGAPGERGWGIVMATDIAFVVGCLAVLGRRAPASLRIFVLSLAIIDDIGAILVIAIGYTAGVNVIALGCAVLGIGAVLGLRFIGVRSVVPFWAVGMVTWAAAHESGIHPTVVGVALGLLTPANPWIGAHGLRSFLDRVGSYLVGNTIHASPTPDPSGAAAPGHESDAALYRSVVVAAQASVSPLERLESGLHAWVGFLVMPLFAFANAGVPISAAALGDPIVVAVIVGLAAGKPIGIVGGCWLACATGLARRATELSWPVLLGAGVLSGIGFTMALFIANLALRGALLDAAKLGILVASLLCALAGMALLRTVLPRPPDP